MQLWQWAMCPGGLCNPVQGMPLEQAAHQVALFATGLRATDAGADGAGPAAAHGQVQSNGAPGGKAGGKAGKRRGAAGGAGPAEPSAGARGAGAAAAVHPVGPAANPNRVIQPWQAGPLAQEAHSLCLRYLALVSNPPRCALFKPARCFLAAQRAGSCCFVHCSAVLLVLQRACWPARTCPLIAAASFWALLPPLPLHLLGTPHPAMPPRPS